MIREPKIHPVMMAPAWDCCDSNPRGDILAAVQRAARENPTTGSFILRLRSIDLLTLRLHSSFVLPEAWVQGVPRLANADTIAECCGVSDIMLGDCDPRVEAL